MRAKSCFLERRKPVSGLFSVFLTGRLAAAQVAHRFVVAENGHHLFVQIGIDPFEPFFDILVNGGFGNGKRTGSSPDGGMMANDVRAQVTCALLDHVFHVRSSLT